ncbi:MAG: hypothetical protein O7C75_14155 [Verrucomicrobia bacterium]|nr:hypothetical protein [Verrucomicrobiota bacterium]
MVTIERICSLKNPHLGGGCAAKKQFTISKRYIGIIGHNQERINHSQIKLNEFRGVDSGNDSDHPILYDLKKLRESSEFIYTTQTMGSNTMMTSAFFHGIAENLQDFLAVLEEYE